MSAWIVEPANAEGWDVRVFQEGWDADQGYYFTGPEDAREMSEPGAGTRHEMREAALAAVAHYTASPTVDGGK